MEGFVELSEKEKQMLCSYPAEARSLYFQQLKKRAKQKEKRERTLPPVSAILAPIPGEAAQTKSDGTMKKRKLGAIASHFSLDPKEEQTKNKPALFASEQLVWKGIPVAQQNQIYQIKEGNSEMGCEKETDLDSMSVDSVEPPRPGSQMPEYMESRYTLDETSAVEALLQAATEVRSKSRFQAPLKKVRKSRVRMPDEVYCRSCGIEDSPEWRRGPDGMKSLCNACGLHYSKMIKREKQIEPTSRLEKLNIHSLLNE